MNPATKDIDYPDMATTISLHSASNYNVIEHHRANRGRRALIQTKKRALDLDHPMLFVTLVEIFTPSL